MILLVRTEDTASLVHELGRIYHDEDAARAAAAWSARALGRFGDPARRYLISPHPVWLPRP